MKRARFTFILILSLISATPNFARESSSPLKEARELAIIGRFLEASHVCKESMNDLEKDAIIEPLVLLSKLDFEMGRVKSAERSCNKAVLILKERRRGISALEKARLLNTMALIRLSQYRLEEAEALCKQAMDFLDGIHSSQPLLRFSVECSMMDIHSRKGHFEATMDSCNELLEETKKLSKWKGPVVARILSSAIEAKMDIEDYKEVLHLFEKQREAWLKAFGLDSSPTRLSWAAAAEAAARLSRFGLSKSLAIEGEDILSRNCGPECLELGRVLEARALLAQYRDEPQRARFYAKKARRIAVNAFGTDHPQSFAANSLLAKIDLNEGRNFESATAVFQRVVEYYEEKDLTEHPSYARAQFDLASAVMAGGGSEKLAQKLLANARGSIVECMGYKTPTYARIMSREAQMLMGKEEYTLAEKKLEKALAIVQHSQGENSFYAIGIGKALSAVHAKKGLLPDAAQELERAVELSSNLLGAEHSATLRYRCDLALIYAGLFRLDEAIAILKSSLPKLEERYGKDDHFVEKYRRSLKSLKKESSPY